MNQKEINNMLDEMISHLKSIKEDVAHGASLDAVPPHNFIKAGVELDMMSNRLLQIADKVCDQTIIKDFE